MFVANLTYTYFMVSVCIPDCKDTEEYFTYERRTWSRSNDYSCVRELQVFEHLQLRITTATSR